MKFINIVIAAFVFFITLIGCSIAFYYKAPGVFLSALPEAVSHLVISPEPGKYTVGITPPLVHTENILAESFLVVTESGVVLAQKNYDVQVPIASLTKIMTGLLLEELGKDSTITISESAKKVEPKISLLPVGEKILADDALTLMLVESDNDIAVAIAESLGGKTAISGEDPLDAFRRLMIKRTQELGLSKTHFRNATGLDEMGHVSTAADLARLVQHIDLKFPNFWDETASPPKFITALSGHKYAVKSSSLLVSYPGIIGMKTGLTTDAEGALIIRYRMLEVPEDIIVVILRSTDRFRDGEQLLTALQSAFRH